MTPIQCRLDSCIPNLFAILSIRGGNATEDFENFEARKVSQYPTPSKRVQATALRAPLQVSNTDIDFLLPSGYYEMGIESVAGRAVVSKLFEPQ